jgi:hypothetical protein
MQRFLKLTQRMEAATEAIENPSVLVLCRLELVSQLEVQDCILEELGVELAETSSEVTIR